MKTSGNTILITGGATGIGLAFARELVSRGNEVIVCGRRADRLEEARAAIPELRTVVTDVANSARRVELVRWLEQSAPRLNMLVNNAGVQHKIDLRRVAELPKGEEEIAINLVAPLYLTALLLPLLSSQPEAAIMNISSGLAFAPLAYMPVYCATKAALHSMTMSLRHQLRDTNVRVFEVAPPLVTSELGAAHRTDEVKAMAMPAEEAARQMVDAMERDELELAIGDAARSREMREELFPMMNR